MPSAPNVSASVNGYWNSPTKNAHWRRKSNAGKRGGNRQRRCSIQYLGGKSRTGKQIAGFLNLVRKPQQGYAEPFCGSCWVTQYITAPRRYCSDKHAGMIALWQALQSGWIPPDNVSEDEYKAARTGVYANSPELETFILFGCTFGGTGRGFARDKQGGNYALRAKRSLQHKLKRLQSVSFAIADFLNWQPPEPCLQIYLDPPYIDRTEDYEYIGAFNNAAFWQRVTALHADGHDVYVSEYRAPDDMVCVLEMPTKTSLRTKANGCELRIERVFTPDRTALPLQPPLF